MHVLRSTHPCDWKLQVWVSFQSLSKKICERLPDIISVFRQDECAIRLENINLRDNGTWICEGYEYLNTVTRLVKSPRKARKFFVISVQPGLSQNSR